MAKMSISDPYYTATSNGNLTIGNYGSGLAQQVGASGYYSTTSTTATQSSPCYKSLEDNWTDADNQEAAGFGWMLTSPQTFTHGTPHLTALFFGTKTNMSDEDILADVVSYAMADTPIAYKILCILTKNRSPYAQWAETVAVLKEKY